MKTVFTSQSAEETARIAGEFASTLQEGQTVFLCGELSAGKTAFVKGVAHAYGIDPDCVLSPTFMLMRSYEGKKRIVHCDLYRLESVEEAYESGIIEALTSGQSVNFVEWAGAVEGVVTCDYTVTITKNPDLSRNIEIEQA